MKHLATTTLVLLSGWILSVTHADEPRFKTRAVWVDPPSFASAGATDELLARCQKAGLNLILPNVMCYQTISFKSPHFRGRVTATDTFDPLAYVIRKARAAGIKVQPWCCVYYEGASGQSGKPLNSAWLNRSLDGRPFEKNFLSPSNPEVNPYLLPVIKDLLAYDIDGIHLDYIRYPGTAFDYSDAGRQAFQAAAGFDPQDFLDRAERIIPPEQEKFPVRVLHPRIHADQVWELTFIERTLDQAGLGFAFVSETPGEISRLRVPGLLIISSYADVSPAMVRALEDYVRRGGNLLWADFPSKALAGSPALQTLTSIAGGRWIGQRRITLQAAGGHPLARACSDQPFRAESVVAPALRGATVIAQLDSGEPAVMLHETGKGRVLVLGFHLMKSTSPVTAALAREIVAWFKLEAGVSGPDPLAAKRAEWVTWRGERVTQLVRDLSVAAKQHDPRLVISSSGGPATWEFYGCYRDARLWLATGINDELFPMNYTPDPAVFSEMMRQQAESAPPGKLGRIFPGLQIYASTVVGGKRVNKPGEAAIVDAELRLVQEHGYQGFCLFACNYLSDEIIEVVRKFGGPAK